jgi:hypothetical protein
LTYDSEGHSPEDGASYTDYHDRYVVLDPGDGHELHRESLGRRRDGYGADCFAAYGEHVWLWTEVDGYHVREARSGRVVKSQQELLGELAASVNVANWDATNKKLYVDTKDARTYAIDATFARTVVRGGRPQTANRQARNRVTANTSKSMADAANTRTSKGTLGEERGNRTAILLDGAPLASTDWLQPELVVHQPSNTLEWPQPPSLIACEPRELGKPMNVVTRVTLEGQLAWSYLRPLDEAATGTGDCLWQTTGDGTRLVMFTQPNGIIGLDVATGREAFRRAL